MKKICLTAISIICIITFNAGLTDCAAAPANVIPTQPSSSPAGDNTKAIDYNQYIKKVWIVKSWDKGAYYYSSFCISKIANGEIEGKFSTCSISEPDYYYYLPNHLGNLGNLTGIINDGIAECQFSDKNGDKGNVKIVFKTTDEIEATINYTDKSPYHKDLFLNGTFLFKPYNLNGIDGFSPFNDQSFTVDLNSWGNVNFVSGKVIGARRIVNVFYLTNKDGDILYNFSAQPGSHFPYNVIVKAVSFQDINKDGLKDIIIIIYEGYESSTHMAKVFFQEASGSFITDGEMNAEINVSGNNKDIETITDYLSKKL